MEHPVLFSHIIPWRAIEAGIPAAFLMRIAFWSRPKTASGSSAIPPTAQLVHGAPSFDGGGQTDMTTCALVHLGAGAAGNPG